MGDIKWNHRIVVTYEGDERKLTVKGSRLHEVVIDDGGDIPGVAASLIRTEMQEMLDDKGEG